MNLNFKRKLPIPKEIKELYPLSEKAIKTKEDNDLEIKKIFEGKSDKFLLIIGPCSADRIDAVMEYLAKLKEIKEKVKDKIVIIPRLFTNKPRSTGDGYKGMLHQPNPNDEPDMLKGLIAVRKLHLRALEEYGFSCSDEMLYTENHRYLSDILSYVTIGARSVLDQQHRLTASGLNIPVGMKNPLSGDLKMMLNSIHAAEQKQVFLYRGWECESNGNPLAHAILRGYINLKGESIPNFNYENLLSLSEIYTEKDFINPSVIVDCNHSNSNKQYLKQIEIAKDVLHSREKNSNIHSLVKGLMIESYLEDGNQEVTSSLIYGKSITDPCLGWQKSEQLILDIYKLLS